MLSIEKLAALDHVMKAAIENGELEGISLYVAQEGTQYYFKQFGYADHEKGMLVDDETIFRMYSMTKPVTAVATMILVERGLLDLNEMVSKYLPGFRNQKVYTEHGLVDACREVIIKDLLNMTAGIVYPDQGHEPGRIMEQLFAEVQERNEAGECIGTVEFANLIGQQPLLFQPGTTWNYGACADVMGAIIEVVSGMRLGEFLEKEIFAPLEMIDTGFYVPKEKQHCFAQLYIYSEEEKRNIVCQWRHLALTKCLQQPAFESAGAGLVSTMKDYAKFVQMLVNGGTYEGKRILSEKMVAFLPKNGVPAKEVAKAGWESNHGFGYGNFLRVAEDELATGCLTEQGEFGWDGWAGTYFFIQPKEKLSMIFLVQRCGYNVAPIMRKAKNIIYSSIQREATLSTCPKEI